MKSPESEIVEERDRAEEALAKAYYIVTGCSPEWSNQFGYDQALLVIAETIQILKDAARR